MMKGRARENKGEEAGEVARCQLREGLPGHRLGQDLHLTKINVAPVWMVEWKKPRLQWKKIRLQEPTPGRQWGDHGGPFQKISQRVETSATVFKALEVRKARTVLFTTLYYISCVLKECIHKNTRVGGHSLLEGIFPTQRSNPSCLNCRQSLYLLSQQGSPYVGRLGHA